MVTLAPRKRLPLLPAVLVFLAVLPARAGESPPAGLVIRRWLALDPVDTRGRVPFNANAPFLRHLLDRASPPPKAGERVKGDRAEAPWRAVEAKEDGTVEDENGAWFYGEIERPAGDRAEGPPEGSEEVFLAHLDGASAVFVNGAGFPGDVYRLGTGPVPVSLRPGMNRLFVAGPRGPWRLRFEPWAAGRSPILSSDPTLPDLVPGAQGAEPAAVRVVNPTTGWFPPGPTVGLRVEVQDGIGWTSDRVVLPPLGTLKTGFQVSSQRLLAAGQGESRRFSLRATAESSLRPRGGDAPREAVGEAVPFTVAVRAPDGARRIVFQSRVDGSVQFFAALPPPGGWSPDRRVDTVLALHGASVDAFGLVQAYSPREGFQIVAPTNRRPFGFDWQDWGRQDAYEVLQRALNLPGVGQGTVFLTGHSMGGHGTWHLAANDPDRWAAIAPSAGWCSFDTYGGGPRPVTPLTPLWRGCDGGSRTEDLVANLVPIPTLVLHGTKDDNVPFSEAEGMMDRIEKAGGRPLRHFQEGAGHWWDGDAAVGSDCVDWPGIFDLFRRSRRSADPETIDFTSADPAVDSQHHWVRVDQPLVYGKPFRVRARRVGDRVTVETENVRRLVLQPGADSLAIDGTVIGLDGDRAAEIRLLRGEERWTPAPEQGLREKSPRHSGPFKRAFDNEFVLVVGTRGTEEENREMLELARYHAGTWWYRANGRALVLRDVDVGLAESEPEWRNFILYGNADTNLRWRDLVPDSCPVQAKRGSLRLGDREWKGEGVGCLFVYDGRFGSGLVGAFASTGARGTRVGYGLLPFVSGVGYPDYAVYGEEFLRSGDGGVLAAGWFDHRWALQPGGFLREETK